LERNTVVGAFLENLSPVVNVRMHILFICWAVIVMCISVLKLSTGFKIQLTYADTHEQFLHYSYT